jgi:hypothetical protein
VAAESNGHAVSLREFQRTFAGALFGAIDAAIADLAAQPGFSVYRNTVMKGCIDALQANYPAVTRLVGEAWFRAAAAAFVPGHLPRRASLLDYGAGFADFLADFAPARDLPYLPDVARVERCWSESHRAADSALLGAASLAALPSHRYGAATLRPHPAARWCWSQSHPVYALWLANRSATQAFDGSDWRGQGVLLTRPRDAVLAVGLPRGACVFLDACAAGHTIEAAGVAALTSDATLDLAAGVAQLLNAGAFAAIDVSPWNEECTT